MNIIREELDEWFKSEERIADYVKAVELLERSGVLKMLMRLGIPNLIAHGSDLNVMASQASWSNGYQTCLEQLKYFVRMFQPKEESAVRGMGEPDFGGIQRALKQGDIRKEDLT